MPPRLLFLLGGNGAISLVAQALAPAMVAHGSKIALLIESREGWARHKAEYVEPLRQAGITQYGVVVPESDGLLDVAAAAVELDQAAAIFIAGGHTPVYHRLYASEPVRSIIRERYRQGIPVAGMSAGALLAPEVCFLRPDATPVALQVAEGLGLIGGALVGVHFTERNALPILLEQMAGARAAIGWGIDEAACAVFEDEVFTGVLGRYVHKITMSDFASRSYRMVEYPPSPLSPTDTSAPRRT